MDAIIAQDDLYRYMAEKRKILKASHEDLIIIESMPCIEIWFLLHAPYSDRYYPSYDSLKQELRKIVPGYDKNDFWAKNIYLKLKDRTEEATQNAKKTMLKKESSDGACSYTNMHELIQKLNELHAQSSRI